MKPIEEIRNDFPGIAGSHRIYLDNAATTQKPESVISSITRFYTEGCANVYRGGYPSAVKAQNQMEEARDRISRFLGGDQSGKLVFTTGATDGMNQLAKAYEGMCQGGNVVTTALEHNSCFLPWKAFCDKTGAQLRVAGIDSEGRISTLEILEKIDSDTRMVALTMMSNVNGAGADLKKIIQYAHQYQVPVVLDAAQAVAHQRIHLGELEADYLVFSGHKLYGPMGIGGLYIRNQRLAELPPFEYGGGMAQFLEDPSSPQRWEAGTPNVEGCLGLGEAVKYLEDRHFEVLLTYERQLADETVRQLRQLEELTILTVPRSPVISLIPQKGSAYDLGVFLNLSGIDVRIGQHCAPRFFESLGVSASCRISLAFYNTEEEIGKLVECVNKYLRICS